MYRLVLYGLLVISFFAILLGFFGFLPFSGLQLLFGSLLILIVCYISNKLFSVIFQAPTNIESGYITSLILFLIVSPPSNPNETLPLILASVLATGSKYLFTFRRKHFFNPAAISLFILGLLGYGEVIWWVGSTVLLPVVLMAGLLIVRKIRRFHLFFSFLITGIVIILTYRIFDKGNLIISLTEIFTSWPLIFFGTIMLTEPLTTPPTKKLQILYGIIVGIFFGFPFHIGPLYSTPELSLLIGNIFSYLVSSKQRLKLKLIKKEQIAPLVHEFTFMPDKKLSYLSGQYLEWTLPHTNPDTRGNRRYFTVASSPTEKEVKLAIKAYPTSSSSFKKALIGLSPGRYLFASQLAGDFTLPKDKNRKLVFIAGGIGITPFRSMIQYLIHKSEKRNIILFYAVSNADEMVYKNILDQSVKKLGIKIIYVLTNSQKIPSSWKGKTGYITPDMIIKEVPDFVYRLFYLSGPDAMVRSYKKMLSYLSIPKNNIICDYFPGF